MKYKMIVSDFDDTILRDDLTVSDEFYKAVADYEKAGGLFAVATGRMTYAIVPILQEAKLKGEVMTFQGAIVADIESGKILERITIPSKRGIEICEYLEDMGVYFQIYDDHLVLGNKPSEYMEMYAKFCTCPMKVCETKISEYLRTTGFETVKILLMEPEENILGHLNRLTAEFGNDCFVATSKPWLVEIVNKKIDKGIAVDKLAKKHGIKREEIICIGDSLNDAPMIAYAGLGAVVANGSDAAKAYADIIVPSCQDDGVAYTIRKYGLGEDI